MANPGTTTSGDRLTVKDEARHDQLTRVVTIPMASVGTSEAPLRPGTTTSRDLLTVKDEARHDRLTRVTNSLEEKILTDWRKLAFKACDDFVSAYWVCRQDSGLMVVFKCQGQNAAMHKCLGDRTRDETRFTLYRETRLREAGVSDAAIASASAAATAKLLA